MEVGNLELPNVSRRPSQWAVHQFGIQPGEYTYDWTNNTPFDVTIDTYKSPYSTWNYAWQVDVGTAVAAGATYTISGLFSGGFVLVIVKFTGAGGFTFKDW